MQFWQDAPIAASSKFVGENFGADEELAHQSQPSRMENHFDEVNFSDRAGLVN